MSFSIVGSVTPDEVPQDHRRQPSLWEGLAARAAQDHEDGRVTVIKTTDEKEISRIRHNLQVPLHRQGLSARPVVVRSENGEIRIFLELIEYKPKPRHPAPEKKEE
jgi:hypothetical protein